ncbi:MAG: SAM-dependent methyltransferase [Deltaproteobacteria bacterium]|nr:SAM-dependent methyltransferase [Deltaproteobacteria bacterium]
MTVGTYKLLDSGNFQKLEQVGAFKIVRPAAQAVWRPRLPEAEWRSADAMFTRFSGGDGRWERRNRKVPETWSIAMPGGGTFQIKLTDFGHLGIFPEQQANWLQLRDLVATHAVEGRQINVLNLFAYTGGSTLACAAGGAHVVHLDASKTSVAWARENAEVSGLADRPIRWLTEDVQKFVARELRRGSKYHGIILDPPSYGRGPKGEAWKIEEMLPPLLDELRQLLAPDFVFALLSSHSAGYTPLALTNLLGEFAHVKGCQFQAEEMVVVDQSGRALPSGATCLLTTTGGA